MSHTGLIRGYHTDHMISYRSGTTDSIAVKLFVVESLSLHRTNFPTNSTSDLPHSSGFFPSRSLSLLPLSFPPLLILLPFHLLRSLTPSTSFGFFVSSFKFTVKPVNGEATSKVSPTSNPGNRRPNFSPPAEPVRSFQFPRHQTLSISSPSHPIGSAYPLSNRGDVPQCLLVHPISLSSTLHHIQTE
ncbi:hypothetical protein BDW42DRAFT_145252 [Aspergillus taichungensis]|uniref:Uncharacterized protein n=1 Tax=Aspergillus taichungensis TaxID=482145 RepID=A0A2J5HMC0_9EURO|nr:hypothetical protein BDW42DRAFT_145252 [Aspergillus taichungensis]